jgi:hypothetical protein
MSDANSGPPNVARRMKGLAVGVVLIVFGIIDGFFVWFRYALGDLDLLMPTELNFEAGAAVFCVVLGAGIFAWFWFDLTDDGDQEGRDPGG